MSVEGVESEAERLYLAGLRAGWIDESLGIVEPELGYRDDGPYLAGMRRGRMAWRRESSAALVTDRPPIGADACAWED
ncbi:MAG: hypothetical protein M0R22_13315 [Dehalococcoidia bacterium]|nr:hypothetical protein [Dehalococcoidia bacterium]